MKKYNYFSKTDSKKEPIFSGDFITRKKAAEWFAKLKNLNLKQFLSIFSISR